MLVKINQLKKIEIMVAPEIQLKIKELSTKATELGYNLDLSTTTSKFLEKELIKIEQQLNKELNTQTKLEGQNC